MQSKYILGTILSLCVLCAAGPVPMQQTQVKALHGEISSSDTINFRGKAPHARRSEGHVLQQTTDLEPQYQALDAAPVLPKYEDLPMVIPGGIATPILARTEPSKKREQSVIAVPNTGTDYSNSNTVLPRDIDWSEIIKCALFWMFDSECLDSAKRSTAQRVSDVRALNEQANHSADVATVGMDQAAPEASSDADHALSAHTTKMNPKHDQANDSEGVLENWTRALGSPKPLQRRHNKDNNPNHIIVCIVTFFIKC